MSTNRKKPDENYISLRIGNALVEILIDSGSSRTLIGAATARALKLQIRPLDKFTNRSMFTAYGSKLRIIGTAVLHFNLKGFQMHQIVYVASKLKPLFLEAISFLKTKQSLTINWRFYRLKMT